MRSQSVRGRRRGAAERRERTSLLSAVAKDGTGMDGEREPRAGESIVRAGSERAV